MNRKLVILLVIVASLAMTAGIAKAAGMTTDWLRVGTQASGGVTYFNGTIINDTTGTGGANNPVTFGDNVRIDGRVYRGATAGTGDTLPFIINDNMEVAGTLAVTGKITATGGIAYSNTASGLTSTTVQGAIDELSTTLSKALSGGNLVADASGAKTAALSATTWKGYAYLIAGDGVNGVFTTVPQMTVVFTPTSETEGTYTSTPYNAFQVVSMGETEYCQVGLAGKYKIVGDKLFVYGMNMGGYPYYGQVVMQVNLRGNNMEMYKIHDPSTTVTYLTRQ